MIETFIEYHIITFISTVSAAFFVLGFSSMMGLYFVLSKILDKLENNRLENNK